MFCVPPPVDVRVKVAVPLAPGDAFGAVPPVPPAPTLPVDKLVLVLASICTVPPAFHMPPTPAPPAPPFATMPEAIADPPPPPPPALMLLVMVLPVMVSVSVL